MPQTLVVSTFPNAKALPLWAAVESGLFERQGLDVILHETGSSKEQRNKLAAGEVHIVQAAIDNGFAMIAGGYNVVIVMGGEGGMNDFVVQPDVGAFSDLAGRRLLVDSPDTAYALLARDLLSRHGLTADIDYAIVPVGNGSRRLAALLDDHANTAAVLNPPFTQRALAAGMKSLGRLDELSGPYQAGGAFALRDWAVQNGKAVQAYIFAYLEALDWVRNLDNSDQAVAILAKRLSLSGEIARSTLEYIASPETGFTPEAMLIPQGLANTISLRARTFGATAALDDPKQYLDLSWYFQALESRKASRSAASSPANA